MLKYVNGTETEHPDYQTLVRRLELRLDRLREEAPGFSTQGRRIDDLIFVEDCDPEVVVSVAEMYGFKRERCPYGHFYSTHDLERVRVNGVWLPRPEHIEPTDDEEIAKCDLCSSRYDRHVKGSLARTAKMPPLN